MREAILKFCLGVLLVGSFPTVLPAIAADAPYDGAWE